MRHSPYYVTTVATANGTTRKRIQARVKEFNGNGGQPRLRTKLGPRLGDNAKSDFANYYAGGSYQNIKPRHAGHFDVYVYVDWESARVQHQYTWEDARWISMVCRIFVRNMRVELGLTD